MTEDARKIWSEELAFLEAEEPTLSDPNQRFTVAKQIQEAKAKLAELDGRNDDRGIKLHYQELLRASREAGRGEHEGPLAGAATIGDLHITLGDLFTQEESFDQAAIHFQEAADVFLPRATDAQATADEIAIYLLPCVEALLKLGDVNERRQRYDRAAAVYALAQSVAAKALRREPGNNAGSPYAYGSHVLMAAGRGDSKWDILKQPLWALRYLSLKRSPFPWAECCEPDPDPFYRPLEGRFAGRGTNDPVYHYRAGQLAFFNGRHASANEDFANAFRYSQHKEFGDDNERAAYLAGYALLDLAENLLVAFMRRQHILIRDQVRGRVHGDLKFAKHLRAVVNCFVGRLFRLIGTMADVEDDETLRKYVSNPTWPGQVRLENENVQEMLRALQANRLVGESELGEGSAPDEENLLDKLDLRSVFGVMLQVARRFERHGLNLHATVAYLKLISFWACLLECIPFVLFEQERPPHGVSGEPTTEVSKTDEEEALEKEEEDARKAIENAKYWLGPIRESAMRSVGAIDGQAFTETWYGIWQRDVPSWIRKPLEKWPDLDPSIKQLKENKCTDFTPSPCERGIGVLGHLVRRYDQPDTGEIESFTLYHSSLYQKILFVNAWHETLRLRAEPKLDHSREPDDLEAAITFPQTRAMVPSSIRSLLFAHWIRGRTLTWAVINDCAEPDFDKTKVYEKCELCRAQPVSCALLYPPNVRERPGRHVPVARRRFLQSLASDSHITAP